MAPWSKRSSRPVRSAAPSMRRQVSDVARRSRCASTSCSRPSSLTSNSTLPSSVGTIARQVADARDRLVLAGERGAAQRGGRDGLGAGDREPRGHAGAGVDGRRLAYEPGEPGDDLHAGASGTAAVTCGLLADQHQLVVEVERVVRADLGAEAVLQRRDDAAAVGVVLGVRAGHEQDVERQPQGVPADLHVALLQHVEQRHLDALGQVGQLVDAEDAAVGARHEAVVHGLGVAERAALGHLDRVDVTDEVADAGVGGGELLAVALVAVLPVDRQVVARARRAGGGSVRRRARTGGR